MQDCAECECVHRACWAGSLLGAWICDGIPEAKICCECPCFPAAAEVWMENGKSIKMSELEVGDRIQTGIPFVIRYPDRYPDCLVIDK